MVKGSEVEVSSQEEGLKGAYFTALLKENTTLSGRKKLSVTYKTLLTDRRRFVSSYRSRPTESPPTGSA